MMFLEFPIFLQRLVSSVGSDSVTPWTVTHEDPLSVKLSGSQYWSGEPVLSPGDLPDPGIELVSPCIGRRILYH